MVDKAQAAASGTVDDPAAPGTPAKRPPHRHTDARDAVAEMAARAQEISQEAGSRIGKAMKDIIGAAAGLAGFAVESARDLAQYMVRRGQMTQEEADKLIREAEDAYAKQTRTAPPPPKHPPTNAPHSGTAATSATKPAAKLARPAAKGAAAKKKTATKPRATTSAATKRAAAKKRPAPTASRAKPKTTKKKKK
jgi:polyhydroxyalkanoate synthesis regulator phasin